MKQELLWIKTNQLQKVIRTGRTGHWLNHGKEHCLIGVKGNPPKITRVLDCDVLVAEVRDTSHKPDEVYGLIERLSPGTRKLEVRQLRHYFGPFLTAVLTSIRPQPRRVVASTSCPCLLGADLCLQSDVMPDPVCSGVRPATQRAAQLGDAREPTQGRQPRRARHA